MKPYQTLLYYRYANIKDVDAFRDEHLAFCKSLGMLGRILVAKEGINGTVSGTVLACKKYMESLENDPRFAGIEFKIDETDEQAFDKMHARIKPELVHLDAGFEIDPNEYTAQHLKAHEVSEMLEKDDVVFLDVRNNVEHEVGKFKDAITMDIDTFREFPDKVKELPEELKEKEVVAYCTGGIRCEKATVVLLKHGFKNVYQIDGGIIKYGKETGGKDFEGECYVFDKRLTVPVNRVNPKVISVCLNCGEKSSRLVNCANAECNKHYVQCERCGAELEGACSEECKSAPKKRAYDGTGYYSKGPVLH